MKKRIVTILTVVALMATFVLGIVGCSVIPQSTDTYQTVQQLLANEFTLSKTSTVSTSKIGLSDPFNVGVDQQSFETAILYNSLGNQNEHVIYAEDFGVNGTDMLDDSKALADAIASAKQYKSSHSAETVRIVLPQGELDFIQGKNPTDVGCAIDLSNCEDIILQGQDTALYMYGDMNAIWIKNSKNVLVTGVNIDWARVPFSVGKVIERSDDLTTVKVKVNSGYKVDDNTVVQGYLEYDQFTYLPRENANDIYPEGIKSYRYLGDQTMEITFVDPVRRMPLNTLVVLRHKIYDYDAIFAEKSTNVYFESVNVYSAPGMGLRAHSCENIYLNRFNTVLKPNTDRLMTVTADSVHATDCKGDLKVTNCIFENRGDDALNTHGMYLKIGEIVNANTLYAWNPRGYHYAPDLGDVIEIAQRDDLSTVQALTVSAVEIAPSGDGFYITFEEELSNAINASMDETEGDVICNPTRSTDLYFANNIVRNSRCRGIVIQTRKATVVNNTFANMSDAAILMSSDTSDWYESMPSQNVVIQNNKIVGNNRTTSGSAGEIVAYCSGADYSQGAVGVQKNITISNNFIANGKKAGIWLTSVSQVTIQHNLIHNVGAQAPLSINDTALGFSNAADIAISNNLINANSGTSFKPVYIGSGADASTFTVSSNTGLALTDILPELKQALSIASTDTTIDFTDKSLDDWADVGTSVSMLGKTDVDQEIVDPTEQDFSNWLKISYNQQGIMLAYSVTDDELCFNDTKQPWLGDGVEIFLTTNTTALSSMGSLKVTEPSCTQLFLSPSRTGCLVSEVRSSSEVLANASQIIMNSWLKADNSGYEGEVFIPFDAIAGLQEIVEQHGEIALCVNFFDVDSVGKQISVSNADAPVENNKFVPGRMPKIKFD